MLPHGTCPGPVRGRHPARLRGRRGPGQTSDPDLIDHRRPHGRNDDGERAGPHAEPTHPVEPTRERMDEIGSPHVVDAAADGLLAGRVVRVRPSHARTPSETSRSMIESMISRVDTAAIVGFTSNRTASQS